MWVWVSFILNLMWVEKRCYFGSEWFLFWVATARRTYRSSGQDRRLLSSANWSDCRWWRQRSRSRRRWHPRRHRIPVRRWPWNELKSATWMIYRREWAVWWWGFTANRLPSSMSMVTLVTFMPLMLSVLIWADRFRVVSWREWWSSVPGINGVFVSTLENPIIQADIGFPLIRLRLRMAQFG